MLEYENAAYKLGKKLIAGVDEVGRGPLIGPVIAASVILPVGFNHEGITDSKKLSEKKRNEYYDVIIQNALAVGVGSIDHNKIDEVNIYEATKLAMKMAVENLEIKPDYILIDAMPMDFDIDNLSIIKGDAKSISIAAASIVAKVTRDRLMEELDSKYPMYGFKNHKGYPTKKHVEMIEKYGILDTHRKTFRPIKTMLEEENSCQKI